MRVTAEVKQATRERIVAAAQRLFVEQGYEATTTRDIAQAAGVATGTLFNYFPTKEAIVASLVSDSLSDVETEFESARDVNSSLEETLFAHVAAGLRRLRPVRKYLTPILDTALSPLAQQREGHNDSLRVRHLETVTQIVMQHELGDALTSVALHLYWTLFTGVLAFWAADRSPKQEDTLALLDQSIDMFTTWLRGSATPTKPLPRRK